MIPPYFIIDHLEERVTLDPQLLAVYPWNDTSVPVDCLIHLHFSGKAACAFCMITVNDTVAYMYPPGAFDPDYSGPKSTANTTTSAGYGAANGLRVLIDKVVDFTSAQSVTVEYQYRDATGRTMQGTFLFACADSTPPTLDSVVLGKGSAKELVLTFSKPLATATITLSSTDGYVPDIASTSISGAHVYVKLADELSFESTYAITADVTDLAGNTPFPLLDTFTTENYHLNAQSKMPEYWLDNLDDDGMLAKLCDLFSEVLSLSHKDIDYYRLMWDYDECYDAHVDRMIESFGAQGLITEFITKRKLLSVLFEIYRRKGIKVDLAGVINTLVGITPQIEEWFDNRFRIGYSKIGGTDRIIGDYATDPFTFRVIFSRALTDAERQTVTRIVKAVKPANTTFSIIEPVTLPTYFRIGYSKIGGPDKISP